jgi:DNA polymerase I-like protein with 3'-5' exonuclease and polymerase domains
MPEDVHMVATVHDELVFDTPIETAEFCRALVEEKMREAFVEMFGDTVPMEVDAKVCSNWGEKCRVESPPSIAARP